jgi:hypothetical protein
MTEKITDQLSEATNVLYGAPSMSAGTRETCLDLLSRAPPSEANVLWVSFTRSPGACLNHWREHHDTDPARYGVIVVGETVATDGTGGVDPEAVQTISNASDLTGIGIAVGEFIAGQDEPIAVCFDSLTSLLQYVDLETAYEFLHALIGQLSSAGAVSHFHLDPTAHDTETVDSLLSLFDALVDLSGDESVIRTRYPFQRA